MSNFCRAIAIAVMLTTAAPAIPAEEKPRDDAAELARDGIEKLMQALELLIKNIPQYEVPFINEHGDIIIKRKNPPKPRPTEKESTPGQRDI